MAQANRGVKRHCQHCGANFYDLNREPIICPKCHADYIEPVRVPVRGSRPTPRLVEPVLPEENEELETYGEDEVSGRELDDGGEVDEDEDEEEHPGRNHDQDE